MKLDGKVALVTGSARGLGWEIVQIYAAEGAKVAICDLTQADVDEAAERLALPPEKLLGVKADVTSERDINNLFHLTLEKFQRLDVLVNNAGFGAYMPFVDLDPDRAEELIRVQVLAVTRLTRAALPGMVARGRGAIIAPNTEPTQSKRPSSNGSASTSASTHSTS